MRLFSYWSSVLSSRPNLCPILVIVLCDTRDISLLIVDTYVTIPDRPGHDIPRYIVAVKNTARRRKYREYRRSHTARTTWQRATCKPTMPKRRK